jgi:DNA-binding NarL/FixJ family response regulator/class 3 adenylate cyclase
MTARLPTGTVTFLFTDIEGSTRLLKQLGDGYRGVLADHRRLLRTAVSDHAGAELGAEGDALFAVFPRARDALATAVAGQRALAGHPWPDGVEVLVRMGLHTAEPTFEAEEYIGLGIHRAARICSAGHGGQILISQASHAILLDDVSQDVAFFDLGEHRLKDLDNPEHLYQVVAAGLPSSFPPLRTLGSAPPADLSFIGREEEPAQLATAPKTRGLIRLVVADDSVLLREGLCRLLEDAGFSVVGSAGDAEQLVRLVDVELPELVIIDIKMPPTFTDEGLVAAEQIRSSHGEVGVLVLSQYLDSRYALRLLQQYPERVGYLLKERVSDVAVLADAVRRIAEGECVIDPTIVSRLMRRRRANGPLGELSDPEREVLTLVAEGHSDTAIGKRLGLEPNAVAEAVQRILFRLGLSEGPEDLRRVAAVLSLLRSSTTLEGPP